MKHLCAAIQRFGDRRGNAAVEFGILAPTFIAMLLGIFWVGHQMQKYNALRSIAADVNRYTVVEYQKENKIGEEQIEDVAVAIAVQPPYEMSGDLDVDVISGSSEVTGAKLYVLNLTYTPHNFLDYFGIQSVNMTYDQNIYVPA